MKVTKCQFGISKDRLKSIHDTPRIILYLVIAMCLTFPVSIHAEDTQASPSNPHEVYPSDTSFGNGIIGVALHLSAHRVGDPAKLYIRAIHPEGPAAKVGLAHGDEILAVDGVGLTGKTYQQIVRMIRGDIGQTVTLQVNGAKGKREVSVSRISEEQLMDQKRT